ncbi:MAG TPA: hypothetical protein VMF30_03820 [Pirellulales bacterium]|nr:hypothetical protein [Pirellulales bacterium]
MIARCHPSDRDAGTNRAWDARPTAAERTGSLRPIGDILGELLASYALPPATPAADIEGRAVSERPGLPIAAPAPLEGALVETLAVCPR